MTTTIRRVRFLPALLGIALFAAPLRAEWIWVEGEKAAASTMNRHPWKLRGTVRLKRPDAAAMKVRRLDPNGYPAGEAGSAAEIHLAPDVIYYLLEAPGR